MRPRNRCTTAVEHGREAVMTSGVREDPESRFHKMYQVDRVTGCWIWTASLNVVSGYPQFRVGKKVVRPYRWYWELLNGQIPQGFECDHICDTPACVNPDHIDIVQHEDNLSNTKFYMGKRRKS